MISAVSTKTLSSSWHWYTGVAFLSTVSARILSSKGTVVVCDCCSYRFLRTALVDDLGADHGSKPAEGMTDARHDERSLGGIGIRDYSRLCESKSCCRKVGVTITKYRKV